MDKEFRNLGETIQDALNVNDEDMAKLEHNIQEILSDARSITNMVNKTISQYQATMPKRVEQARMRERRNYNPVLPPAAKSYQTRSILMIVFGGILAGTTFAGHLTVAILHMILGIGGGFGFLGLFLWAAISAGLLLAGIKGVGRVSRFKKYLKKLGDRTYCTLKELGTAVGKSVDTVREDVKFMVNKNWFEEGHMDLQETCLITSDETYEHYRAAQLHMEEAREEEAKLKRSRPTIQRETVQNDDGLSPEVREMLKKGNTYLTQIRVCNNAIPGEEITAKITKMEQIVDQIFARAQEHPEIIPDLKRMMDYYLPTSIKLLEAYVDMDAQTYQGENIQKSKRDIEQTIDTLNLAFEKLMDSVFQDTAMDVASDISVLNTILAQEGLTEDGMMGMH